MLPRMILFLFLLFAAKAYASDGYRLVDSVSSNSLSLQGGTVSIELFISPDCSVCQAISPGIESVIERQDPGLVSFTVSPAPLNPRWAVYSRAFYVLKAEKLLPDGLYSLYDHVLKNRRPMITGVSAAADFFEKTYGINPGATEAYFNSVKMTEWLTRDYRKLQRYDVQAVPAIVVNNRWLIDGYTADGVSNIPEVLESLITSFAQEASIPAKLAHAQVR